MKENGKSPKKKRKYQFSKNLRDMRSIAVAITGNKRLKLKYDGKAETSHINLETEEITLSLNPFPDFVKDNPLIAQKCLSGLNGHECGHDLLSKPNQSYFNNWVTKIKRNRGVTPLAHILVNIVEDKRVNYFIGNRYRFDIGKRLALCQIIIKDTIETTLNNPTFKFPKVDGDAPIMVGILANVGLYGADIPKAWQKMDKKAQENTKKALDILENTKYMRLRIDIIKACQQIYDLIAPFCPKIDESKLKKYIPVRLKGKLKGELSKQLKEKLKGLIETEEEKEKQKTKEQLLEDLLRGCGAGLGTGKEIPTPEPDFNKYQEILDRNKEEIARLLNLLKQRMKPLVKREIFRKRGRFMSQLLSKAHTNSFRNIVKNVYLNVKTRFEKEKVAIGFLIDYSGSVNRRQAEDITVILNEVFGHFVEDSGYSISVFGADSQKVKTFFETFNNTKARCGNIGVNTSGTEISVLLRAYLKMFNNVDSERRKILVIASDFYFGDNNDAKELIALYPKANVELIFMGFTDTRNSETWASNIVEARRTGIKDISDLPERFLSVYTDIQL